jgi:hypothetical protein
MKVRESLREFVRYFILHKMDRPPYRPIRPLPPPVNGVPQIPPFEPRGELAVIDGQPLGTGMREAEELRRRAESQAPKR